MEVGQKVKVTKWGIGLYKKVGIIVEVDQPRNAVVVDIDGIKKVFAFDEVHVLQNVGRRVKVTKRSSTLRGRTGIVVGEGDFGETLLVSFGGYGELWMLSSEVTQVN